MFKQLLQRIAKRLDTADIPYFVMGGQAVLLYGEPRLTRDVDITLGIGPDGVEEVLEIAIAEGWRVLPDDPKDFVMATLVLPLQDDDSGIQIEFIFSFSPFEQEALARANVVDLDGYPVRFASVEDIIVQKVVAGRPRDIEDVASILKRNERVDMQRIEHWLRQFEDVVGGGLVERFREVQT